MNKEEYMKDLEKEFFEAAKKLAVMLVKQAEAAGIEQALLGQACDIVCQGIQEVTNKQIIERFGSIEKAEEFAMEQLEKDLAAKNETGKKIVDLAIVKASKNIH